MYLPLFFCIFTKLCNHCHSPLWNISITLKRNPVPFSDYSIVSCVPSGPRQPLIYFLSLQTCLFCSISFKQNHVWVFVCVCVCDWHLSLSIFSRFIHVSVLLFFLRLNCKYIPHLVYIVISCWTFGLIPPCSCCEECYCEHSV